MVSTLWVLVAAFLLIIALLFLLAYREYQWGLERKDLYDRIMAGGLSEYRNDAAGTPPPKGGNMITAGLRKARQEQMKGLKGGDD